MTRRPLKAIVLVLLLPAVSFAAAKFERGNRPKSALNYPNWPGIVDVVNDVSRESWCWVNGGEWLSYRGDTAALNRVLKEFGEVEAEELRVVLLPGPGRIRLPQQTDYDESKDPSGNDADWELRILQGLARWHAEHKGQEAAADMEPTLTVYVSERIDLNALQIPKLIKVLQRADLHGRAKLEREQFEAEKTVEDADADKFDSRLAAIQEFIQRRQSASAE